MLLAIALFLLVTLVYSFSLGLLPGNRAIQEALRERHVVDYERFDSLPSGTRIALTGTLTDNETVDGEVVAFRRDMLVGSGGDGDPYEWGFYDSYIPNLNIAIENGEVQTSFIQPVSLGGENIESLETYVSGGYEYRGAQLGKGSTRTFMLRDGDSVTLVGVIQLDKTIGLEVLYGEAVPADLERFYAYDSLILLGIYISMVIAIFIFGWMGISRTKEGNHW